MRIHRRILDKVDEIARRKDITSQEAFKQLAKRDLEILKND